MRLALVVPLASLARLVSSSSFLLGYSATHGRSESKILFDAEPVGFTRFRLASVNFFEDENWQEVFLRFGPDI